MSHAALPQEVFDVYLSHAARGWLSACPALQEDLSSDTQSGTQFGLGGTGTPEPRGCGGYSYLKRIELTHKMQSSSHTIHCEAKSVKGNFTMRFTMMPLCLYPNSSVSPCIAPFYTGH